MADSTELLAQLRDIHLPAAPAEPALWPLLAALAVIATGIALLFVRWHKHRNYWAKPALVAIDKSRQHPPELAIQSYATLLKRLAITLQPADKTLPALHGEPWLQYLDNLFNTDYFSRRQGQMFGEALYQQQTLSSQQRDSIAAELGKLIRRRSLRWW